MATELNEVLIRINVEGNADEALNQLAAATATVEKKFGVSAQRMAKSFNPIQKAVERANSASGHYTAALADLNRKMKAGQINQQQFAQGLEVANRALARSGGAMQNYALQATRGFNSSRMMGTAVQQAGFQVGDFAVQVASGQSAMRAFIQQGTQLISMFGPQGAVAGAALAIGGAIWMAFATGVDGAKEAKEAAKTYADELKSLAVTADELRAKLKDAFVSPGLVVLEKQAKSLAFEIDVLNAKRTSLTERIGDVFGGEDIGRLNSEFAATAKRLTIARKELGDVEFKLRQTKNAIGEQTQLEADLNVKNLMEEREVLAALVDQYEKGVITLSELNQERKIQNELTKSGLKGDALRALETELRLTDALVERMDAKTQAIKDAEKAESDFLKMLDRVSKTIDRDRERDRKKAERERIKSLKKLQREEERIAKATSKVWKDQFSKMGDAFTDYVMGVKMDSADMINSIISDLLRLQIQKQFTDPLAALAEQAFSGFSFGSLFGGGNPAMAVAGVGAAEGGLISGPGSGTSDSILAALSNGEFVINANATKQNRALLEAINSGTVPTPKRFAVGGMVGTSGSSIGGGTVVNILDQRSGNSPPIETNEAPGPDGMRQVTVIVRDTVRRQIAKGEFDLQMGGRYGAQPTTTQRG